MKAGLPNVAADLAGVTVLVIRALVVGPGQ